MDRSWGNRGQTSAILARRQNKIRCGEYQDFCRGRRLLIPISLQGEPGESGSPGVQGEPGVKVSDGSEALLHSPFHDLSAPHSSCDLLEPEILHSVLPVILCESRSLES